MYEFFAQQFPELGPKETRSVVLLPFNRYGLPTGEYGFLEAYCNDKDCDCRRVFLHIVSRKKMENIATITYGWESLSFYKNWFGASDSEAARIGIDEMVGVRLATGVPQSKYAPGALKLVQEILEDPEYDARIKRHYQMFKEKTDPRHFRKQKSLPQSAKIAKPARRKQK